MGLVSFLRAVLDGTDGGRRAFESDPVSTAIARREAGTAAQTLAAVYSAPVDRAFALSVPAVLKGRNVICSVATLPLVTVDAASRERVRSPFLEQIDPQVPNLVTLAMTLEDLVFESIAWWQITRYGFDGFPLYARHVLEHRVSTKEPFPGARLRALNVLPSGVDPASVVWIDGAPVDGTTMIRFDSPNPPLLGPNGVGKRAIRRAALLDAAASMYAEDPRPLDYFTPSEDADPEDDEVQEILDAWADARRRRATGYVPGALNYHEVQSPTPADLQLVQLQQRTDLQLANMLGLDPEDVGVSTTSRTYQNVTDRRRDRINDALSPYMLAVTSRLSMNDVTKRGQAVTFDLRDYLKADPMTQASVDAVYLDRQVVSVGEVRGGSLNLPDVPVEPRPALPATPSAAPAAQAGQNASRSSAAELEEHRVSIPASFSVAAPERDALDELAAERTPAVQRATFDVLAAPGAAEFKVDAARRTVTGLAVPFGEVTSDWRKISFAPGSVEVPAGRSVPVLMSHGGTPLGVVSATSANGAGMTATLRLSKTVAGDEALTLAQDKAVTGLSIGVDIHAYEQNTETDVTTVTSATLREISLTPFPAFDSARVDKVNLSRKESPMTTVADNGTTPAAAAALASPAMTPDLEARFAAILDAKLDALKAPAPAPAGAPAELPADFVAQVGAAIADAVASQVEVAERVNPVRGERFEVVEPAVYRLDGTRGEYDLSTDLFASIRSNDGAAKQRLQKFMADTFVNKANVADLSPSRQRPDLFVDEKEFVTPLWDSVNKGSLTDSTPFVLPKFNSAGTVVSDHTEGTEPGAMTYTTTSQTITPAALSGKVTVTRETVDQGGNPQLSTILWAKINRAYSEALESKVATMLNALSAGLTTLTITTAAADGALAKAMRTQLSGLQFVRGGFRFRDLKLQVDLYTALAAAADTTGRPIFPSLNAQNSDGSASPLFGSLNVFGLSGMPAWALGATSTNSSKSWLYDRNDVHGWATPPRDLGLADQDVANVYIGVFGYQATACTDITGVRALAYDPV